MLVGTLTTNFACATGTPNGDQWRALTVVRLCGRLKTSAAPATPRVSCPLYPKSGRRSARLRRPLRAKSGHPLMSKWTVKHVKRPIHTRRRGSRMAACRTRAGQPMPTLIGRATRVGLSSAAVGAACLTCRLRIERTIHSRHHWDGNNWLQFTFGAAFLVRPALRRQRCSRISRPRCLSATASPVRQMAGLDLLIYLHRDLISAWLLHEQAHREVVPRHYRRRGHTI